MPKKKHLKGWYNSTSDFVNQNNLSVEAKALWGKDWESEDDTEQIKELLEYIGFSELTCTCNKHKEHNDLKVHTRKFKLSVDDLKDLKYKITQKLVEEGLIKDCTDTDDEDEVNCENAIEEVFKEFVDFDYS